MVSAIILAYNRCPEVLITIDKLKTYRKSLPFAVNIIVVDNASTDDTTSAIIKYHPDVTLITKEKNNGIAGWNEGFKIAKDKYFLVLDDDSHPFSGLPEAIERMEQHPDIGILPFQIKDINLDTDPYLNEEEAWKDNDEVVGFIGCGAIIKKELYDKIGGYADWIYLYTHEFEYAIRCLEAGYRINFFGNGVIIHRVSALNRSSKRMRMYATRNEMLIVHKYFNTNKLRYLSRVLINNLKFTKREGVASGYYVCLGYIDYLKGRRKLLPTPVTETIQNHFAENFWSTKPVFARHRKKLNNFK